MIKRTFKIIFAIIFVLLVYPNVVKANFGDLNYRITNIYASGDKITFKGWAYIHRTNNYAWHTSFKNVNGEHINGGQIVLMRAYDKNDNVIETVTYTPPFIDDMEYSNGEQYNFYVDLFYKSGEEDDSTYFHKDYFRIDNGMKMVSYKDRGLNECQNDSNGTGSGYYGYYCLYEDIEFTITFDTATWDSKDDVYFKIGASNYSFENKITSGNYYEKNKKYGVIEYGERIYTPLEDIYVDSAAAVNLKNSSIKYVEGSISNQVEFIAKYGSIYVWNGNEYKYNKTYGTWKEGNGYNGGCINNIYTLVENKNVKIEDNSYSYIYGVRPGRYYVYVSNDNDSGVLCPTDDLRKRNEAQVFVAHVKVGGNNKFRIITDKKCELNQPDINLNCNENKTFNSTCEELAVGSAKVKIDQKGSVSSVLTPDNIYAGGGINFGIMYTNTIRWSYVLGQNINEESDLHKEVVGKMNDKIKDYQSYITGVNISNLQMGGKTFNMVKKCTTSNENKDYYNKELTVSCIFTIPSSIVDIDGNVEYNDNGIVDITNKYYTPLNYNGIYSIAARISGMDRITEDAATKDSIDHEINWTGVWEDTFECNVNLYTLIAGIPKYIYRPIDINNPFPNRNAGINWYDWINIERNKERLQNTYSSSSNINYTVRLDNAAITDIKNYNNDHDNYLKWDSIDSVTGNSSFIDDKDYIVRSGN